METLLFGSFLTQYDAIQETFKEKEPFLNIDAEAGGHYYRVVIILKTLFVLHSIKRVIPESWSLISMFIGNLYVVEFSPTSKVFYIISCCHACGLFFLSVTLLGFLSLARKPYEFLIDVFVVLCMSYYAAKTYKREIQKVSCLLFVGLYIHWYVNNQLNTSPFSLSIYSKIILLLLVTYFPLMPNRPKYRYRLTCFYVLIYLWIFYKVGQHYDITQHKVCQIESKSGLPKECQTCFGKEKCNLNATIENLEKMNIVKRFCLNDTQLHKESLSNKCQKVTLYKTVVSINQVTNEHKLDTISHPTDYGYATLSNSNRIKNDVITEPQFESVIHNTEKEFESLKKDSDTEQYFARKVDVKASFESDKPNNGYESTVAVTIDIAKNDAFLKESGEVTGSVSWLSRADNVVDTQHGIPGADEVVDSKPEVAGADDVVDSKPEVAGADEVVDNKPEVATADEVVDSKPEVATADEVADSKPRVAKVDEVAGSKPQVAKVDEVAGSKTRVAKVDEVAENEPGLTGAEKVADSKPRVAIACEVTGVDPVVTGANEVVDSEPRTTAAHELADGELGAAGATVVTRQERGVNGPSHVSRKKISIIGFGTDARNKFKAQGNSKIAGNKDRATQIGEVAESNDAAIQISKVKETRYVPIKIRVSQDAAIKVNKVSGDKDAKIKIGKVSGNNGGAIQIGNVPGRKSRTINVAVTKGSAIQLANTPGRKTRAIIINKPAGSKSAATKIDKVAQKYVQDNGDVSRSKSKAVDAPDKVASKFEEFTSQEAENPENDKTKRVAVSSR